VHALLLPLAHPTPLHLLPFSRSKQIATLLPSPPLAQAKSTRDSFLQVFPEVFDALFRLCSDADTNVQNAASFLDNLCKVRLTYLNACLACCACLLPPLCLLCLAAVCAVMPLSG
jgi:hypothetical protein